MKSMKFRKGDTIKGEIHAFVIKPCFVTSEIYGDETIYISPYEKDIGYNNFKGRIVSKMEQGEIVLSAKMMLTERVKKRAKDDV